MDAAAAEKVVGRCIRLKTKACRSHLRRNSAVLAMDEASGVLTSWPGTEEYERPEPKNGRFMSL